MSHDAGRRDPDIAQDDAEEKQQDDRGKLHRIPHVGVQRPPDPSMAIAGNTNTSSPPKAMT
jgi:hypothetical protein